MDKKVKKKWLSALRSKAYKQGSQQLRKEDSFCCLGVLCDLYAKEHDVKWTKEDRILQEFYVLPDKVVKWAGLPDQNPNISVEDRPNESNLAELNDAGVSFAVIADIIETSF